MKDRIEMEIKNPNAYGIDIGSRSHFAYSCGIICYVKKVIGVASIRLASMQVML
jgi:hypothetical protein